LQKFLEVRNIDNFTGFFIVVIDAICCGFEKLIKAYFFYVETNKSGPKRLVLAEIIPLNRAIVIMVSGRYK